MLFKTNVFWILIVLAFGCRTKNAGTIKQFNRLMTDYAQQYDTLGIPSLGLSYQNNLGQIQSTDRIDIQEVFFEAYQQRLTDINIEDLPPAVLANHYLLSFEVARQLERIELEKDYLRSTVSRPLSDEGIYFVPGGKSWYRYYLKSWLMEDISPEELEAFGREELRAVQRDIQQLQFDLTFRNDSISFYEHLKEPLFFEKSTRKIKGLFETRRELVNKNLGKYFHVTDVPEVYIEKGDNPALSQVPAYYNSGEYTFYFNVFDQPFNKRLVDLLYLHEAVPGHHYQLYLEELRADSLPAYYRHLKRSVFREGWAAYVEELGEEMGLYRTPYDWMGKHEWDLVRSARVVMDIGINYRGWSDEKALLFWKENIDNQNDIAMREIQRMRRWPAQVITYKYGAAKILGFREQQKAALGKDFNLRDFHQKILDNGGLIPGI